jgi:CBS domain containing-hemolysin-like protein
VTGIDIAAIVVSLLLLTVAATLSAAETVLQRLGLVRALRLQEEEAKGAEPLLWAMEHRASAQNVVLVLTVTTRVVLTGVVVAWVTRTIAGASGIAIAAAAVTVVSLIVAEVAPRTLALRHLEETALKLGPLLRVSVRVFDPLARVFVDLGRLLVRTRQDVSGPFPADDEVSELLSDEDEDEELEDEERAMIHSVLELGDTVVREIMVPRPDMVTVEEGAALRDVVNVIIEHGHSRIPVYRDSKDDIVGVLYAKDVMRRMALRPGNAQWVDLVRDASFVPETKRVDDLLRYLQEQAVHQAIVVDEYGATVGLVTIEDVLEEIVGEIVDEHDREDPLVEVLEDDRYRIDARLPVDELNELLSTDLPDDEWDTVGGLVFGALGRVPDEGESVDIDGLHLVAERVQGRRVSKVLVGRRPTHDDDHDDEPQGHDT